MDDTVFEDVRRRLIYEGERIAPPLGFPALPDLPIGRFTDPAFHQIELDRVFRGTWLCAGHVSQWPQPGSYRALSIPIAPLIVVRGDDGVLRAFLNACRHRGAPVVRDREGQARHLVCQFHSWSYDLAGCLVGVPEKRDFVQLDQTERGLREIRCELWGGLVFVSLDPDAPDLLDWLGPIGGTYGDLAGAPHLRHVDTRSYEQACNWKVMVDAFVENYHVKTVHRDSIAAMLDVRRAVIDLYPGGHSGFHIPYRERAGGERLWVANVGQMDLHPIYSTYVESISLFPNMLMSSDDTSGFFTVHWWPLALDRTRMDVTWYGVDWGDGPRPADWDIKLAGSDMLMQEDQVNLEPIQQSLEAAAHPGMPLSYAERRIWHFHAALDQVIGPDCIPAHLRAPDLLRNHVWDRDSAEPVRS